MERIMADNRKYYYLKLKENYFDEDAVVLLESMQDGIVYSNILLKLYLKSLKNGGKLQLDENIPYTAPMIATITRQQVGTVEKALQIFMKLGLVELLRNGGLYMSNIELLIGQSSTEGERKRRARQALPRQESLPEQGILWEKEALSGQERLSEQEGLKKEILLSEAVESMADKSPRHMADICPPEINREKEKEKDTEKKREEEIKIEQNARTSFGRYKNVFLCKEELIDLQKEFPDKWEYYIDRLSTYMASTGKDYKNHAATIQRWGSDDQAKNAVKKGLSDYSYKEGQSL